jgi:hypothetical protein
VASYDEAIPPGQAGKITATLKTEAARGPIEKSITVTSNDDSRGPVNLRLRAQVVGSVEFLPRAGLLLPAGAQWEWSAKLLVRKDETEKGELKISDVTASVPWLKATATPVTEPLPAAEGLPLAFPGDWIMSVEVTDEAPKVQGGFQVKFKTGLTREPEATLPVSVVIQHPMRAVPLALQLQAPPAGGEVSGTVTLSLRPGLDKEVPTATVSPDAFTVRLEPAGHRKYAVRVGWRPDPAAPESTPRQGAVILKAADQQLTVQVRVSEARAAAAAR